jgi:DNA-binding Xre family transcriptional regulator
MSTPLQKNLKYQLAEKNMSANSLEKKAGLKPSAVQNILQGKSKRPAAELLLAICEELNCSIEDLVNDEPVKHKTSGPSKGWSPSLYMDALKKIQLALNEKKIEATKQETLELVDELYLYSRQGSLPSADKRFADWLVAKKFS